MFKSRELTFCEIDNIYQQYMTKDFPENELKPLSSIERMYQQGRYKGFVMEEDGEVRAYWMLLQDSENKAFLLDYFAVLEAYRGQGYGSKALAGILGSVKEDELIVIEAENPMKAGSQSEKEIQERRLDFYRRNGVVFTELASVVYEAAYVIMYLSKGRQKLSKEEAGKIYVDFYEKWILGKEKCEKYFVMENY